MLSTSGACASTWAHRNWKVDQNVQNDEVRRGNQTTQAFARRCLSVFGNTAQMNDRRNSFPVHPENWRRRHKRKQTITTQSRATRNIVKTRSDRFLEVATLVSRHGVGFCDQRNYVHFVVQLFHHFNVQRLKPVSHMQTHTHGACWATNTDNTTEAV